EEFDTYWREQHAPLLRSVTEFSRHVRRYVQCHRMDAQIFAGSQEWDGIVELCFDSVEAMEGAFAEPKYAEVIRADEMKFVDLDTARVFVGEELRVI
ncbi:MAG: EthD domain-containing protein, partial [Gammaproteobacteria bacterium]|nr:EthD domain-containing protein [Gammaproteobacteria bacterium]